MSMNHKSLPEIEPDLSHFQADMNGPSGSAPESAPAATTTTSPVDSHPQTKAALILPASKED